MNKIVAVERRTYPCQFMPEDPPATLFVLVEGMIGDYAAYVGHGREDWVSRFGHKLSYDEAVQVFPGLTKEKYRT